MEIRKFGVLHGRNRWSRESVFELLMDLSSLEGRTADQIPQFRQKLLDAFPEPSPYVPARDEVTRRLAGLRSGGLPATALPESLARIALGLTGCKPGFGRTSLASSGLYHVILGYEDERFDRACVEGAIERLRWLLAGEDPRLGEWLRGLLDRANTTRLGPSTLAITRAAETRGVPVRRLNSGSLVQLGWGSRQRRIWTAQTDRTSGIASDIASDKELTRQLLHNSGVPAPLGRVVASAEEAWTTALELGLPTVVKPRNANHAQGVAVGLTTREQVVTAFGIAAALRSPDPTDVIVERHIPGVEHRLLVVAGRMVAAYRGQPARVIGDGVHTVRQLVDEANKDPRRGQAWHFPLDTMEIDELACLILEDQGYGPDSVLPAGVAVDLTRSADLTTDVTDEVHPEVAARVVEAAAVIGLDIAGIDLVTPDIHRPMEEQGGAIVEVNAGPGLMFHLCPAVGSPRPVGEAIAATLFPDGENGRIPIVAVLRAGPVSVNLENLAAALTASGYRIGRVCADGVFLGSRSISPFGFPMSEALQGLLTSPLVELALVEVDPRDVLEHGLGFDEAAIAVVDAGGPDSIPDASLDEAIELLLSGVSPAGGTLIVLAAKRFAQQLAARSEVRTIRVDAGTARSREPRPAAGASRLVAVVMAALGGDLAAG
jgi:cyanophycin synthetase